MSAALVLVAVACTEDETGRAERSQAAGQPGPPTPTIERYSTGARPWGIEAVGTTLLAYDGASPEEDAALLRSADLGETWEPLVLPGAPDSPGFHYQGLGERDGQVWVAGVKEAADEAADGYDSAYLWISRDGSRWQGGRLPTVTNPSRDDHLAPGVVSDDVVAVGVVSDDDVVAGIVTESGGIKSVEMFRSTTDEAGDSWVASETPEVVLRGEAARIGDIWEAHDGVLVADLVAPVEDEPTVLESHDDGRSWQIGSCPDESEHEGDCEPVSDAGSLEVGPRGVSTHDGDWQEPVLDRSPAREDQGNLSVDRAFEIPGGGWLANANDPGNENYGDVLVRSDDGVTWQQLLVEDPCLDDDLDPSFDPPVRLGSGWLVEHTCWRPGGIAGADINWARSDLYVLDGAATRPVRLPGTQWEADHNISGIEDDGYGPAVVAGDVVLVPVPYDHTADGFTEIVRITP
jgi:hypothetical protein